jgi:filamentous hemagglutinin family protein
MKYQPLPIILLLIISLSIKAEVTLDGTLGRGGSLPGPDYLIGAELGQQRGGNLFHSFRDFNLNLNESATFSGPNTVQNVISRVTGGNPSNIDGLIRSTIPNADMYFINPYGIMFGPNALLDVQGSFHASTAEYLRFSDGGRFEARQPNNSLLTVAPIEAFGFLNSPLAPISVKGQGEVSQDLKKQASGLSVPEGKTLSLIGSGIEIKTGTFFKTDDRVIDLPLLRAPSGKINLISVASPGEVISTEAGFLDISSFEKMAAIKLSDHVVVEVSGEGSGSIFIRAGSLELTHSDLRSERRHAQQDGLIDSNTDTIHAQQDGVTDIQVEQMSLTNSHIQSVTNDIGKSNAIVILVAETLTLSSSTIVGNSNSQQADAGDGGKIQIEAEQLRLEEQSSIASSTFGAGQGGSITLKVADTLSISGKRETNRPSGIVSNSHATQVNAGAAGQIEIEAGQILIESGSIGSNTFGFANGGAIVLKVAETLALSDGRISSESTSIPKNIDIPIGHAGRIEIEANRLSLTDQAKIAGSTVGVGDGGTVLIKVADVLTLSNQSKISAFSRSAEANAGKAGEISVQARAIKVNKSVITTETANASGGNITLTTPYLIYLQGGKITTTVKGGTGDGGNITIDNPVFVVLDQGQIKAQADEGRGGNIRIGSNQFIASPLSLVSASSRLGIDGNVEIDAPEINMDAFLQVLPGNYFDASGQFQPSCDVQRAHQNRFVVKPYAGRRASPSDWKASHLLFNRSEKTSHRSKTGPFQQVYTGKPSVKLVLAECQPRPPVNAKPFMNSERQNISVIEEQLF